MDAATLIRPAPRSDARKVFLAAAVLAGAVTVAFTLSLLFGIGGAVAERVVSDLALCVAAYAAAVSCALRSLRESGRMQWSWLLIACGTASWGLGQTVWTWYECVRDVEVPFPSLADVGYLGMPVFTAAGLLVVPLAAQSAANRARSVLDGLMVAGGLLLISYMLLLGSLIQAGADSLLGLVISLAYPVSDVVIVTIVLYIFARDRQRHSARMPLLLVGAGLLTFSISDSGFAYLTMVGAYSSGAVIDAGWFAGFLLLALAGLRPSPADEDVVEETSAAGAVGILLPYLVVLGTVAIGAIDSLRGRNGSMFVYWGRSLLILLMVGRQALTMLENRGLTRNLERRVDERTADLRASEQRFEALVQHSSDVVTVIDLDTTITYQSESVLRVFGQDPAVLVGSRLTDYLDDAGASRLTHGISTVAARPYGSVTLETGFLHADGAWRQAEITITNLLEDANVAALVLNSRDVTEQKRLEDQLVHEAFHDALTDLANRALFVDRVEQELRRHVRTESPLAVLFLDLDGFKEINDSRGHAAGDEVLKEVAARLSGRCEARTRWPGSGATSSRYWSPAAPENPVAPRVSPTEYSMPCRRRLSSTEATCTSRRASASRSAARRPATRDS